MTFELDIIPATAKLCPVCGETGDRKFRKNYIWILDCPSCGHRFAEIELGIDDVHKIYDGQYFQGDGIGYLDYLSEANLLRRKGQYYAKQLEQYSWPGSVLDVGAAAGFVLHGLMEAGWQGRGIEPNERIANFGCDQLHLHITPDTLETFLGDETYDLVMMVNVLSHIYDLQAALEVAERVTKPGGLWLIETWNRQSWTARLRGEQWRAYCPPAEKHWFTPQLLKEITEAYGLEEVKRGRVIQWINIAALRSMLRYQSPAWCFPLYKLLGLLPSSWSLPYSVNDRFWALYQKKPEENDSPMFF
ncbi:MAG: methyltransferase domain-containing protein [Thermosynechococcaceae cyanobacterium]